MSFVLIWSYSYAMQSDCIIDSRTKTLDCQSSIARINRKQKNAYRSMADVLPPHSAEAEEAVLGSLMIDPAAAPRVAAFLTPGDFYIVKNGWIYDAILTVGEKADLLTVSAELARNNLLEE